nr:MAG TPA: hypothetical protein [Caudoviricetes sp.]
MNTSNLLSDWIVITDVIISQLKIKIYSFLDHSV